ncbi:MAG TPA: DUF4350 domain-containing protein [Caulobacterales bacterium]|nr:DUF4350 domain-containing protein [Caulobacterales bacterium]
MSTGVAAPSADSKGQLFSVKVVLALIFVGVFSFSAFLTLSTFAPDLRSGEDGRAHALSRSSVGFAAAVQLARARGAEVVISRTPFSEIRREGLFILAPEDDITPQQLAPLSTDRVLIILPKWATLPKPGHRGWALRVDAFDPQHIASLLHALAPGAELSRDAGTSEPHLRFAPGSIVGSGDAALSPGYMDRLQTISGKGLEPVIVTEDGRAVMARLGHRPIYILADPDFLNTHGVASLGTARVGMAMLDSLREGGEPIVFDVTLNGFARERSIMRLAFEPPFVAATLSLLAVALLLAWRSITRSGPQMREKRAIALGKKALAENSAALIRLAHREHKMAKGYAALTGAGVMEMIGLARAEDEENAAALDRIGAAQGVAHTFSELAAEAAAAQTGAQALAAARKLHQWKEEMLRATR